MNRISKGRVLPRDGISRRHREQRCAQLRNEYLHGEYRLSPAFLNLAIHVREAADAIWSRFATRTVATIADDPSR